MPFFFGVRKKEERKRRSPPRKTLWMALLDSRSAISFSRAARFPGSAGMGVVLKRPRCGGGEVNSMAYLCVTTPMTQGSGSNFFQIGTKCRNLPPTGDRNAEGWAALGPLAPATPGAIVVLSVRPAVVGATAAVGLGLRLVGLISGLAAIALVTAISGLWVPGAARPVTLVLHLAGAAEPSPCVRRLP